MGRSPEAERVALRAATIQGLEENLREWVLGDPSKQVDGAKMDDAKYKLRTNWFQGAIDTLQMVADEFGSEVGEDFAAKIEQVTKEIAGKIRARQGRELNSVEDVARIDELLEASLELLNKKTA